MAKPALRENLGTKYQDQSILRGLVQLIPFGIGSAFDTAFLTHVSNLRERRVERFFDALATGKLSLTEENAKSDDFAHKFIVSLNAATRTHRSEKIDLFASLLINGTTEQMEVDEFDELLQILDDLSVRELIILECLFNYENQTPRVKGENALQHSSRFWNAFKTEAARKAGVPEDSFDAFLTRLARTGMYEPITGTYLDYHGGQGKITPLYMRLKDLIQSRPPSPANAPSP